MKNLIKIIASILVCFVSMQPVMATSDPLTVTSLTVGSASMTLNYSGSVLNDVLAVAVLMYDPSGALIAMDTCEVKSGMFSDSVVYNASKAGTYSVKAANYAGGDFISTTISLYTITYELNGGANNASNYPLHAADETVTLQNPSRSGYNFKGWYSDSSFGTQVTSITGAENKTVYAKWEAIPSEVTTVVASVVAPKKTTALVPTYSQNMTSLRNNLLGESTLTNTQFSSLLSRLVKSGIDFMADFTSDELSLLSARIGEVFGTQLKTVISGLDNLNVVGLPLLADLTTLLQGKEVTLDLTVSDQISDGDKSLINDYVTQNNYAENSYYALDFSLLVQGVKVSNLTHPLTITLPIPESMKGKKDFILLHVTANGVESIPVIVNDDGSCTFTTSSFSTFVLLDKSQKIEPVVPVAVVEAKPSISLPWVIGIATLMLGILGFFGFKFIRKTE